MKDLYLNEVRYRPIEEHKDYLISEKGELYSKRNRRVLKQTINRNGYKIITLLCNGKIKGFYPHRLVATAFVPNPDNKPQVNHINGNKTDNRVENLEWVTCKENIRHAVDNDLFVNGMKSGNSKLTDSDIREIRRLKGKVSQGKLASYFRVTQPLISYISNNKMWRHVV